VHRQRSPLYLPYVQSVFHKPLLAQNLNEIIRLLCSWCLKIFRYLWNLECENLRILFFQAKIFLLLQHYQQWKKFVKIIVTCSWNSQLRAINISRVLHFKRLKITYNYYYESLSFWSYDRFICVSSSWWIQSSVLIYIQFIFTIH
jgi:hypothetical protein